MGVKNGKKEGSERWTEGEAWRGVKERCRRAVSEGQKEGSKGQTLGVNDGHKVGE